MSEAPSEKESESSPAVRRRVPPIVHGLAVFVVFLGFLVYPFTGSRGTNILAGLILLAYVGARNVLHAPFQRLQRWLTPRERLKNLLLALSVVVSFAGSLEAVGQLVTRAGWIEPYSAIRTQLPYGVVEDFRAFHITSDKYRVPDPVLLWRPVNRWPFNSQRMKGPVAEMPKPPGLVRVMSFGDSNTDGTNDDSWSRQLHLLLTDGAPDAGRRFEVINAGVAGYSSYQGLLRFRRTVDDFQPDLVFVSFGWNDPAPGVQGPDKSYRPPAPWLAHTERAFLEYRFYRVLKTVQVPHDEPTPPADSYSSRVSLADYRANLQAFLDEARDHGAVAVFLTRPYRPSRDILEAADGNFRRFVPAYNDAVRAFAADTGAPFVDVQRRFAAPGSGHHEASADFVDECHFSAAGRRAMAEMLAEELTELLAGSPLDLPADSSTSALLSPDIPDPYSSDRETRS